MTRFGKFAFCHVYHDLNRRFQTLFPSNTALLGDLIGPSVFCRRGPSPPEVCWAPLREHLHRSWAGFCLPPNPCSEPRARCRRNLLLLHPFSFSPWASRSPPANPGWNGGTHRCLWEGAGWPSSHCEGIPPLWRLSRLTCQDRDQGMHFKIQYLFISIPKPIREPWSGRHVCTISDSSRFLWPILSFFNRREKHKGKEDWSQNTDKERKKNTWKLSLKISCEL